MVDKFGEVFTTDKGVSLVGERSKTSGRTVDNYHQQLRDAHQRSVEGRPMVREYVDEKGVNRVLEPTHGALYAYAETCALVKSQLG